MGMELEALASAADLVARYDARRIADLVKDDGTRVDPSSIVSSGSPANVVVVAALLDASREIEAASRVAARYTHAQLYGDATTTPATPGSTLAKRLCCDLAFGLITGRRGYPSKDQTSLTPRVAEAQAMLQALREGVRIFDVYTISDGAVVLVESHAQAGLPKRPATPNPDPSLLSSQYRYFGFKTPSPNFVGW